MFFCASCGHSRQTPRCRILQKAPKNYCFQQGSQSVSGTRSQFISDQLVPQIPHQPPATLHPSPSPFILLHPSNFILHPSHFKLHTSNFTSPFTSSFTLQTSPSAPGYASRPGGGWLGRRPPGKPGGPAPVRPCPPVHLWPRLAGPVDKGPRNRPRRRCGS